MAYFSYRAHDRNGAVHKGVIQASSVEEAVRKLKENDLFPIRIGEATRRKTGRVRDEAIITFCRELANLLRSGLPVDRALILLAQQESDKTFRRILQDVHGVVRRGGSLSEALQEHESLFGVFLPPMIRAGEASGTLIRILEQVGAYLERKHRFKQNLISASIYPMLLLGMSMISMIVLLVYVLPRFARIFQDLQQEIPAVTAVLLKMGLFLQNYGWTLPVIMLALFFGGRHLSGREYWRRHLDRWVLNIPFVKNLVIYTELARFFMTIGTMVNAGVPLLKSIHLALSVVGNGFIRDSLKPLYNDVRVGRSVSAFFAGLKNIPVRVGTVLRLSEERGELGRGLMELGEYFESETGKILQRMITLMEPVVIIGTGCVIGAMVLSMFGAIVSITEVRF
ncbi:type II secretion system F family protein [Thermodesulforhabdus norvegica]|uniref:General secretion pathway protein F n=1 Tax=Thermodesulforhabdus norvegica TaxID=39841 RepID=A0A1I4SRS7_9BACT|nr:type II secretion system F family protein [Thermodesulforhabdus norvegica]SFM67050.1 general secretion pathway protein F [Thermodesulforhabdus norvegica]